MKWRFHHKARKAFLTTAICLALSQSVFAMPTGGKVIEGDITGITNGTIASGGTINVAGSGLIDWNAFGIGAGETLNYAFTSPGTLINHVTGADMSQLLGTLNSTGNGNLWLINPNGIVVGSSAQLNAGSLVLSTLDATDEVLKGFLQGGNLTLTSADATKGIEVQSRAKISATDLTMLGGHIQIADNVTVSSTGASGNDGNGIALLAGNQVVWPGNAQNDLDNLTASDANVISVNNATLSAAGPMALIGGKVDVTNSQLTTRDLEVVAGKSYTDGGNTITGTDATNVSIGGSTLQVKEDATLIGSNINLADTKLEVGTSTDHTYGSNGVVRIAAGKDVTLTDDNTNGFVIGSVNQTGNLTMDKVNLSAYGTVMAYGKTVKLQDSVLSTTNDKDLTINAVNTYKRVNGTSDSWTATPDNTIEVSGSTLTDQGIIELSGGKVTVEKSSLTATGHDGFVDVNARASYTDEDDGPYVNKAVAGMDVNVKDTKLSGDDGVGVFGHTVTVDGDSSLTSKAGKVFLAAGKTVEMTDDSLKGDGAPVNIGKNVKYDASKTLFAPDKKLIETTKPSDPGTKPSDPGKNPSKPPVVTPDPQPAADIAKNIAQGQADMAKALQENPQQAAAAVQQQAEKLSRSTMTETEKVAQLKGYVEAIQATQESAETKNDLLVTVVKSFEPTQQEGITAQTKQDEAAQTKTAKAAVNAAAVSQPTVVPADQTPLVTVDSTAAKD
ncbi:filamentous hemagglutinin N-terminal domain-containing protein [Selenomonas bovis]|uniref:filamentous hemagglutinin N-terminal domain-containing protein n=1 Tax=Selenomonas bovis TaxID=416586 RepID=UPI003D0068FE